MKAWFWTIFISLQCVSVLRGQADPFGERYQKLSKKDPAYVLFEQFKAWEGQYPDSAFYFAERFHQKANLRLIRENDTARRRTIRFLQAIVSYDSGVLHHRVGNTEKSIQLLYEALRRFLTLKDDEMTGLTLNSLGVVLADMGRYQSAIRFYHASIRYKERMGDVSGVAHALNNIGVTFRDLGDLDEAKAYYSKSLDLYAKNEDSLGMAVCYNNLGAYFSRTEQLDSAYFYYARALSIRTRLADPGTRGSTLNNLGVVAKKEGKFELADSLLNEALTVVENFPNRKGLGHIKLSLAELHFERYKADDGYKHVLLRQAIEEAEFAYTVGHQLNNPDLKLRTTALLAELYAQQADWKKAYAMLDERLKLSASQNSAEVNRQVLKEAFRFEQQKMTEISRLKDENYRQSMLQKQRWTRTFSTLISIALIVLLSVLVFIILQLRRLKEKNKTIQRQHDEREVLLKEIHHRVKNNFQIISSLLRLQAQSQDKPEVQEALDEAVQRIHALSLVHEIIYKQEDFTQIETTSYFNRLFAQLEAMNIGKKVRFELKDELNLISNELLLPLAIIVNELVTNSFKHAFPAEGELNPVIYVGLSRKDDRYFLNYSDNGIGYQEELLRQSFGFELIETLAEQFNGKAMFSASEQGVQIQVTLIHTVE
jgi:two-component system, sensor histidine kinase PdtaS